MNLQGINNNIRARKQIGRGGLVGQRAEGMITLGSQYYDAADASIDCEWAVAVAFSSQACSLHHRLALCIIGSIALVHRKNGWIGEQAIFAVAFASQVLQIITQ